MNVFTSQFRNRPWEWQVAGLCFLLGLLLAGSLQTVSYANRRGFGPARVGATPGGLTRAAAETLRKQQTEIASLRENQTKLETALAQRSGQSEALNEQLQNAKLLAGLSPVKGQGIILLLADSSTGPPSNRTFDRKEYLIHDFEIQRAINELYASGAEAVAVNNQRITARSPVRCVGPTIQVNGVPLTSPFEIRAIGDPVVLMGGLNMVGGVLEELRAFDPAMVKLEQRKVIELPPYTGSTEVRFAHPVVEGDVQPVDKQ